MTLAFICIAALVADFAYVVWRSLPPGTVKGRMRLGLAKLREDPQIPA